MRSDSLLISLKSLHQQRNWYYPFILQQSLMEELDSKEILNFDVSHFDHAQNAKQKAFAKILLTEELQLQYLRDTLIRYNEIYNL
jgi:uncharacterized protein YbaP (TraB family)